MKGIMTCTSLGLIALLLAMQLRPQEATALTTAVGKSGAFLPATRRDTPPTDDPATEPPSTTTVATSTTTADTTTAKGTSSNAEEDSGNSQEASDTGEKKDGEDEDTAKSGGSLLSRVLPPILIIGLIVGGVALAFWYWRKRSHQTFVEAVHNDVPRNEFDDSM